MPTVPVNSCSPCRAAEPGLNDRATLMTAFPSWWTPPSPETPGQLPVYNWGCYERSPRSSPLCQWDNGGPSGGRHVQLWLPKPLTKRTPPLYCSDCQPEDPSEWPHIPPASAPQNYCWFQKSDRPQHLWLRLKSLVWSESALLLKNRNTN